MNSDKIITLVCYFIISIFGLLINLFCLFKITTLKEFRHCFGYICICQLIANCLTSSIFIFWSCPSLIIFENDGNYETINQIFGKFGILAWNITMYSHIASCINRCIAMFLPTKYGRIFNNKTCVVVITAIWGLSICHVIPYTFFGCIYKFSPVDLTWTFVFTKCTKIMTSIDLYLSLSNVCISLFLDSLIFIKLGIQGKKSNQLLKTIPVSKINSNFNTTNITKKHEKVNKIKKSKINSVYNNRIRFFLQSFIQNLLIAGELICFHIISYQGKGKLWAMAFSSCAWAMCHTIDGIILCVFNKEIRNSLLNICSFKQG